MPGGTIMSIKEFFEDLIRKNFLWLDSILSWFEPIISPKELISKLPRGKKYALAGSIPSNNIEEIAKLGVNFCDLSSSLESDTQIGYKDHQKIIRFIKKVNELKN